MNDSIYQRDRRYGIATRAAGLSLVVHALVLWLWPDLQPPVTDGNAGKVGNTLAVRLQHPAPPTAPPLAAVTPPAPAAPPPPATKPRVRPRVPPQAAPLPTLVAPAPRLPELPPPPVVAAPTPPPATDLSSYIEARRRARGEQPFESATPPSESADDRTKRVVAANLGANVQSVFGYEPKNGGGTFQIRHLGFDDAEFYFYGWNKDARRDTKQLIEVRRGDNPDIEIAVVRKIIAIIREHEPGDFVWVSERNSRNIRLSARLVDNASLEAFMMREFFPDERASH